MTILTRPKASASNWLGKLQERYGYERERAEKEADDFADGLK